MQPESRDPSPAPAPAPTCAPARDPAPASYDATAPSCRFKSKGGVARLGHALRNSLAGLAAAWRHEAAFRQELALGLPLIALALWAAPGRWQALVLVGSVLLVWIVELLNSALEALADAVSPEQHPLLGRAKDLGSAAVMLSLAGVALAWGVVFWP